MVTNLFLGGISVLMVAAITCVAIAVFSIYTARIAHTQQIIAASSAYEATSKEEECISSDEEGDSVSTYEEEEASTSTAPRYDAMSATSRSSLLCCDDGEGCTTCGKDEDSISIYEEKEALTPSVPKEFALAENFQEEWKSFVSQVHATAASFANSFSGKKVEEITLSDFINHRHAYFFLGETYEKIASFIYRVMKQQPEVIYVLPTNFLLATTTLLLEAMRSNSRIAEDFWSRLENNAAFSLGTIVFHNPEIFSLLQKVIDQTVIADEQRYEAHTRLFEGIALACDEEKSRAKEVLLRFLTENPEALAYPGIRNIVVNEPDILKQHLGSNPQAVFFLFSNRFTSVIFPFNKSIPLVFQLIASQNVSELLQNVDIFLPFLLKPDVFEKLDSACPELKSMLIHFLLYAIERFRYGNSFPPTRYKVHDTYLTLISLCWQIPKALRENRAFIQGAVCANIEFLECLSLTDFRLTSQLIEEEDNSFWEKAIRANEECIRRDCKVPDSGIISLIKQYPKLRKSIQVHLGLSIL